MAAAKFARVAGNWSTPGTAVGGTWSSSCAAAAVTPIPTAADDITICNGINVTVDVAGTAGSVTVATGATATALTLGAAGSLTVTNASGRTGDVTINGPTAGVTKQISVGTRTLAVTGNVNVIGGTTTASANNISQLAVTSGIVTVGGNLNITAGNTVTNVARVTLTTGRITVTGNATVTGGNATTRDALLNVAGASAAGNGVNIGGNLVVAATFTTSSTVSITVAGGRITVTGNVSNGDTITVGQGIFTANGATFTTTNAAIPSSTTVAAGGQLNIAGNAFVTGGSTASSAASITGTTGTIAITGNATVTGGSFNPSGATLSVTTTTGVLTVGGALSINGGTATNSNATVSVTSGRITVTGNTTVTGRTGATGGTASLVATLAPVAPGTGINLNGTLGVVTTAAGGVATGLVNLTGGGVINVAGNVTNGGTVTIATGTFNVTNAASTYTNSSAVVAAATTISTGTLTVAGNLTNATGETITRTGAGNINVGGNWSNSGTFTPSTGTVTFNGTAAQTLGGSSATTFNNLTINNTAALAANSTVTIECATPSPTVNATLTLTSGDIVTSGTSPGCASTCATQVPIIVAAAGTIAGGSATSNVRGALRKMFSAAATLNFRGAGLDEFPLGDATNYTPIEITAGTTSTAGSVTACVTATDHPQVTTPVTTTGIDAAKSVNRYWSLTIATIDTTAVPVDATFKFVAGDVDVGATTGNFIVENYGTYWRPTTLVAAGATSTRASNIVLNTAISNNNDMAVGEPLSGVTAVPGRYNAFETATTAGAILGKIQTKVAGTGFTLDIVHVNATKTGVLAGAITVEVRLLDSSGGGVLDANGCNAAWPLIQALPNFNIPAGGRGTIPAATVTNSYRSVRVEIRSPVGGPYTQIGCSTDLFAIRPASLTVTAHDATWVTAGTGRALANTGASGGNVHKAATAASPLPFTLRATPVPAIATLYDGSPTAVAGFPACGTLCTTVGALAFTAGSWTAAGSGVRENATANYSEAGTFNLRLEDSTYASVDAVDGSSAATRTVPATATVEIGRFVPSHFVVATNNTPQFKTFNDTVCALRAFTYIGQPFGYVTTPQILVTAKNLAGGTTANYGNTLWKIAAAAPTKDCTTDPNICTITTGDVTQVYTYTTVPVVTPNWDNTQVSISAPTVAHPLNDGTGTVAGNTADVLAFKRNVVTPQALFAASITLAESVKDASEAGNCGVAGAGACDITSTAAAQFNPVAFDSGSEFRYGRLRLSNAFGSEKANLDMLVQAQYWSGNSWILNSADSCTSLLANAFFLTPATAGIGASAVTITGGAGTLTLTKPTTPAVVSVDVAPNLGAGANDQSCLGSHGGTAANQSWLRSQNGNCAATYDRDPSARATFGLNRSAESRKTVHVRERF